MSLKMKLTSAIIMFMLIVATLVIGVIAAESQTISMKGNVSFNINDRSLYLKSVRYKVGNDATEPVTLENFLPGYIDANMEVNIGDHEFNYSAFTLYFDIVNTTQNTYNAVEEVTLSPELSSQGVTASASGQISPTQEIDSDGDNYAEIMPTSEPTGTITLTITSTSTQAINLGDITITIEQYIRNLTEEGFTISENSITGYTGSATDLILPAYYTTDESGNLIEATASTGTPITSIADRAFQNNRTLTSITIPETVKTIDSHAFFGCLSLQTVDFGTNSSLQTIGSYAFSNCISLTTITIPKTVTSIEIEAFQFCYALAIVYNNSSLEITAGDGGDGDVGYYAKEVVTAENPQVGRIETIDNVKYYINKTTKKKIALLPAAARDTLTSVTLASDTTEINQGAFRFCTSLTTITIPESVNSIGDSAFSYCSSLTTITIPDTVTSIENYAFEGCSRLTTITIPETVTSIGQRAFYSCTNLQYNTYGEGKYLGSATNPYFALIGPQTTTQTSITINPSCKIIADDALSFCRSLQTVNFNNCQITEIPDYAFRSCSSLTTITIPESVNSIGSSAFSNCTSLTTVIIENSDIYESATSTSACGNLLQYAQTVKVPTSFVSAYDNSFLEGLSSTTEMIGDVEYTVFTI